MKASSPQLLTFDSEGIRWNLQSPTLMPRASAFLWNRQMMLQANCRGYVIAQHMQPEPAKYSHGPALEARTFMQPEQPYYAHHPGRFVYIKDERDKAIYSVPHEPVRRAHDQFVFSVGRGDLAWVIHNDDIEIRWTVQLPTDDALELWTLEITNQGNKPRSLSVYPTFTIGYMSWMNQSAQYNAALGAIVARSITPYQRLEDYAMIRTLKDMTFLLHDTAPIGWETVREIFEGEGGMHRPDGVQATALRSGDACYESPIAVLHYRVDLTPGASARYRFVFGPARTVDEIAHIRDRYLAPQAFDTARREVVSYLEQGEGVLKISTPDAYFDRFVNHWLGRQVYYHGAVNRLTTDPQTRNFLQDAMGMCYVQPERARAAFIEALSQQAADGQMPEGILLSDGARLKYINTVPHADHNVWLPICLESYLNETGDDALLDLPVAARNGGATLTVFERVSLALRWLCTQTDVRGLSLIAQGDWCDPMNMVGHRGLGVSGWLSMATVYGLRLWARIAQRYQQFDVSEHCSADAQTMEAAIQKYLWDGQWFARGITDDGKPFGVSADQEGRIYLNPQSFALLSGVATADQRAAILQAISEQIDTLFGPVMLAPAYTAMREDVGRLTQKSPGSAENGSIYNHAAAFYIHALYHLGHHQDQEGQADRAFSTLRVMLPGPAEEDLLQRGQLPVFVPNYYRGCVREYPRTAGRSSQLFNTGSAAWLYRNIVEGLFGLRGDADGLWIAPQLPSHWEHARVQRRFRGALFDIDIRRGQTFAVRVDDALLARPCIEQPIAGRCYRVDVTLPPVSSNNQDAT